MDVVQQGSVVALVAGEEMIPQANRTLFWPAERTLFVADVHLGKGAAFRAGAVPVPTGSTQDTLSRLHDAVVEPEASRLVILGDLWHAAAGRTCENLEQFLTWRGRHPGLSVTLVEGNHDVKSGPLPLNHEIEQVLPG